MATGTAQGTQAQPAADTIPVTRDPCIQFADHATVRALDDTVVGLFAVCADGSMRQLEGTVQRKVNHWRIFLVTEFNQEAKLYSGKSVVLDMKKVSGQNLNGCLYISQKHYSVTNRAPVAVAMSCGSRRVTVREVVEIIRTGKLQHYRYGHNAEGCRHWVRTVIETLLGEQVVDDDALTRLNAVIPCVYYHPENEEKRSWELHIQPGTFIFSRPNVLD